MLRPVISVLMIVIAKATSSVQLFSTRRGYQPEHTHTNKHTHTYRKEGGWRHAAVLMRATAALELVGSNL